MRQKTVLLILALLAIGALISLLAWALLRTGGTPGGFAIKSRLGEVRLAEKPAPDFTMELFQGGSIKLSDLRGKVIMVDLWASWCPPCRKEAPVLEEVYREYKHQGVEFIGVDIWDDVAEAKGFLARFGISYPNGLDAAGKIAIDYGVTGIPEKMFIDREGVLVRRFVGPMDSGTLRRILNALLQR